MSFSRTGVGNRWRTAAVPRRFVHRASPPKAHLRHIAILVFITLMVLTFLLISNLAGALRFAFV